MGSIEVAPGVGNNPPNNAWAVGVRVCVSGLRVGLNVVPGVGVNPPNNAWAVGVRVCVSGLRVGLNVVPGVGVNPPIGAHSPVKSSASPDGQVNCGVGVIVGVNWS